jgi:hypothetical protein
MPYSEGMHSLSSLLPKPIQAPKPAEEFMDCLRSMSFYFEHSIKEGENYRMLYIGCGGPLRIQGIGRVGSETLRIDVKDADGISSHIITHVSQCSVQFQVFSPANETEAEEKVLLGFAEGQEAKP